MNLEAKNSKCWTCKHGICIRETEQERLFHAGLQDDVKESYMEIPDENDDLIEHLVEHERIKAICYWKPDNIKVVSPFVTCNVQECSRYEQNCN